MPADVNVDALILNVDDSDGARYAKTRVLQRAGFRVIEAASGGEALALAQSEMPDLILLDVKLPDINGMEVCRQLKRDEATRTVLVLQTSASYIGTADKIRALDGGADNYLVEPIEPDELIANVRALLRLGAVERELRESHRLKDEFLATLAHELRNPLGPIRTATELLRKLDPVVPPLQENARNAISRHTNHLTRLVDDLLDVSRITKGKISLQMERVELNEIINNALESSTHAIESRRHQVTVSLPETEIFVHGDPVRLSQIVTNLLLNAAKFTRPGGQIDVVAECTEACAIIRVTDNGIGIPPDSLDAIFELFSQGGHLADRVQDGLGIGLSLVRALVQLHNGSVSARSAGVGQGSSFEIKLPLANGVSEPTAVKNSSTAQVAGKRVLVVDDTTDSADILAQLLELSGHQVVTAYTGAQAIERAAEFVPEVVILDIGLPDLTGYEVAVRLRGLPNIPRFLMIALTGYGQAHDREAALAAGFDEHITKPLDFGKLAALGLTV